MPHPPTLSPAPPEPKDPYLGLVSYTENEADLFFGREAEAGIIIGNLRAARLTLLYAQSGVGKTSLLRAGVAARLRAQAERDLTTRGSPRLVTVYFSAWSDDPFAGLRGAIDDAIGPFLSRDQNLERASAHFGALIEETAAALDATLLVMLDQFEEYVAYRAEHDRERTFIDALADCINQPGLGANFLISIREDAYAALGDLFRGRISNVYANFLHLDHLTRDGARQAIEEPLKRYNAGRAAGVGVEPQLVEAVLEGVRVEAGSADRRPALIETTYLQLVMKRLWDEEASAGADVLRLETLERLGGAAAIIATHLDRAMAALSPEQRDAAALVFTFLVTRAGTKIALAVSDIAELSGLPERELDPLLRRLADQDLHILRPIDTPSGTSYEIFHDALGQPIVDWRTRHRENQDRARRAELAAQLIQEQLDKEEAQRQTAAAERREQRERKRKRIALLALFGVLVALVAVAVLGFFIERGHSSRLTRVNQSNEIASRIDGLLGPTFGPQAAALAGLDAYRISPTFNARQQVLRELQDNVALPKVLVGHERGVEAVTFSPSGRLVASGSDDAAVRLWNRNGQPIGRPLVTPDDPSIVTSVALSPSAPVLAAARGTGAIDIWPQARARVRHWHLQRATGVRCSDEPCHPLAISPVGQALVWGGTNVLRVWTGPWQDPGHRHDRPRSIRYHFGVVRGIAFSPDGRDLAVASDSGVTMWRSWKRDVVPRFRHLRRDAPARSVAWAPDGSLAAGTDAGILRWTPPTWDRHILYSATSVYSVAFARESSLLVSGGNDNAVTVWNTRDRARIGPPRQHRDYVNSVAVSPEGDTIASASNDGLVKLWSIDGRGALARIVTDARERDLALGANGRLATATPERMRVWHLRHASTSPEKRPLASISDGANPIAYHGNLLVGADPNTKWRRFNLWDTGPSCAKVCSFRGSWAAPRGVEISAMAFDRSGDVLATGTNRGRLTVWDISNPRAIRNLGSRSQPKAIHKIAFDPAHPDVLATAAEDGSVRLWDDKDVRRSHRLASLGKPLASPGGQPSDAVAFSPNGQLLATGGQDQAVVLWNVDNPARPRGVGRQNQSNTISSLAFSPDSRIVAAGDADGSVCTYDAATLRLVGSSLCLTGSNLEASDADHVGIEALQFDPSGSVLVSAGREVPVTGWSAVLWSEGDDPATDHALGDDVCVWAGRNLTASEWNGVLGNTPFARHRRKTCPQYPLP
jgi:WD40 repeat protein